MLQWGREVTTSPCSCCDRVLSITLSPPRPPPPPSPPLSSPSPILVTILLTIYSGSCYLCFVLIQWLLCMSVCLSVHATISSSVGVGIIISMVYDSAKRAHSNLFPLYKCTKIVCTMCPARVLLMLICLHVHENVMWSTLKFVPMSCCCMCWFSVSLD